MNATRSPSCLTAARSLAWIAAIATAAAAQSGARTAHESSSDDGPRLSLVRDADGHARFVAERLGGARYAILLGSLDPDTRPVVRGLPDLLAQAIVLRQGPIGGADAGVGWSSPWYPVVMLGGQVLFTQLVLLDDDGGGGASGVLGVPGFGTPGLGRHADCDAGTPAYDGPALHVELVEHPKNAAQGRALTIELDAPSTGYDLYHFESRRTACGEDVHVILLEPLPGQAVEPVVEPRRAKIALASEHGPVRVFVGRAQQHGDVVSWRFDLARVVDARR